ncbi:carboxymuconolactone decarboxylase family protein [Mycobacterium sp. NPDC051804]|uniref:carboxymuconolactone decarboxylase family protein n=1 Tax=Mycobacterium sp. NPDC051804 TaxID=3364295 RepID=UPI00378C649F
MSDENLAERIAALVAMSSGDGRLDTLTRLTCGRALSLHPLPMEIDLIDGGAEHEPLVCTFAEQFAVDVSGITDNQRKLLSTALGNNVFRTVVMIFVADFVPRVWAGFEALGLRRAGNGGDVVEWDHDSDPTDALLNGFLPAVARLRGLDPVTTEVVRLRGAAQHNCRLCKSRRETSALDAGGSEHLYSDIEQYESSEKLTDAHKAALRFVDAMIWTPSQITSEIAAGVRRHFSEDQAFELTLDIMRNAANKIMVSLGVDAPLVTDGTELFSVDADGQTVSAG